MKEELGLFSVDIILLILLLVIFFKSFIKDSEEEKSSKLFSQLVLVQIISLIAEYLFNLSLGSENLLFIKLMTFVMFGFNYSLAVIFFHYLLYVTDADQKKLKPLVHAIEILYTGFIILFFINMFTGWIVDFTQLDESHSTLFQIFRFIPDLLVFVSSMFFLLTGKNLPKYRFTLICYSIFPLVAVYFELESELFFMNVGFSVALILIYINIQADIRKRMIQRENELMQEKEQVMLSQIQPHFLYNSLSAIMSLCDTEPEKVKLYISDFSKYLRGNLESLKLVNCVSFEKEMEHVNLYLKFEKLRFEEKIKFEYELNTIDFMVPSLSIQPLVENAVRHGICKKDEGGFVKIFTEENKKEYIIKIEDNGVGFDASSLESKEFREDKVGINSIKNRLKSMLQATLEIQSKIGEGTVVTIIIPK